MVTPVSSVRVQAQAPIARDNPDLSNLSYCEPAFLAKLEGNASCVFYDGRFYGSIKVCCNYRSRLTRKRTHDCHILVVCLDSFPGILAKDVVFPYVEESAVLLSSRVARETYAQPTGCNGPPTSKECMWGRNPTSVTTFVPVAPERFTLYFDHNTAAPSIGVAGTVATMNGVIQDRDGNILDPCEDCTYRKEQRK